MGSSPFLLKHLVQVRFQKRPTIADITQNHIKSAKNLDYFNPPTCTCNACSKQQQPAEPVAHAFKVTNKTTPNPGQHGLSHELQGALKRFVAAKPNALKHVEVDTHNFNTTNCIKADALTLTNKKDQTGMHTAPSKKAVMHAHKMTKHMVVSPLDKDSGSTWLECKCMHHAHITQLYKADGEHYEFADKSKNEIMKEYSILNQKYLKNITWTQPRAKKGDIPYGYGLPKAKDPKGKTRPVVSYYNHPSKQILRAADSKKNILFF